MLAYFDPTDPEHMTVDDRVAEVAAIVAAGVLRLHRRPAPAASANAQKD